MKTVVTMLCFSAAIASASGMKPCEELKSEIAAKLEAKGVKNYALEIVPIADAKGQTVIGSCEAGTKNITYKKGDKAPENGAGPGAKPPAAPKGR
jgi:hypothetical protein